MDENLVKIRHARSEKDFPFLKLEDDEYVEFAFKRAKICFMLICGGVGAGLALVLFLFLIIVMNQAQLDAMGRNFIFILLTVLVVVALLVGWFMMMIFRGNKLFLTNRHAIQMIMKSPFSNSTNIIDLTGIEDASFSQNGILQHFFGYGTLRLSTVGDETTYTFPYSDITAAELKAVSKLISSKKEKASTKKDK